MIWYRGGVNPNPKVFYGKIDFPPLVFQRWTAQEKSHLFKNHVCDSTSFFPIICFQFARCTLTKRWCIHWPDNVHRNCSKRNLIRGIKLRSIALLPSNTAIWKKKKKKKKKKKGKASDFFIWGLKKFVRLKQCYLYGFCFRDAWKRSI